MDIGRAKDHIRITQFVEANAFDPEFFCAIIKRHDLQPIWARFCERFEIDDPSGDERRL